MTNEKEFFKELGSVPNLPPDIYGVIHGRIRRGKIVERTIFALAATLVIAIGTTAFFLSEKAAGNTVAVATEVAGELQSVNDYLNGNDLDEELQAYTVEYQE
jgi:hypothetical protein